MPRTAFCLLLVCLSANTGAREMRSDEGSCPEIAAAVAEAEASSPKARTAAPAANRGKASKPAARGTGEGQRASTPRWHSFLPGMFR